MRLAKRIFLADASNRERLAGEPCQQNIMVGNVLSNNLCDVARNQVSVAEIVGIGFLGIAIPFAGEDTLPTYTFKSSSDATNPRKQINKRKTGFVFWSFKREHLL